MKRLSEVILAVWPDGIPSSEYDRLFRLLDESRPSFESGGPTANISCRSDWAIGARKRKALAELLTKGPVTVGDVVTSLSISPNTAWLALRQAGAVVIGRDPRGEDKSGSSPGLFAIPAK